VDWGDFEGPTHQDELMISHEGQPSVAVQNLTHGAGTPPEDRGEADQMKYSC
jgi:hypothetical protein